MGVTIIYSISRTVGGEREANELKARKQVIGSLILCFDRSFGDPLFSKGI